MFSLLKAGAEEPDADHAATVGVDRMQSDGGRVANPVARDMLLRMPGVSPGNVTALMEAGGSLAEIADMELAPLQMAIGQVPGKALFEFLHLQYPLSLIHI